MVYINKGRFIAALGENSEDGGKISVNELKASAPRAQGELDRLNLTALAVAANSEEPDGTRFSRDEIDNLIKEHVFSPDFFTALQFESCRSGSQVRLFSDDIVKELKLGGYFEESFGYSPVEFCKHPEAGSFKWFEYYLRLEELGLMIDPNIINKGFTDPYRGYNGDEGFWQFLSNTVMRYYIVDVDLASGYVPPELQEISVGDFKRDILLGLWLLYRDHKSKLEDFQFISFIDSVKKNFGGIQPMADILYFWDIYNTPSKRQLLEDAAPFAKIFTSHIPLTGSLGMDELKYLVEVVESGVDLNDLAEFQTILSRRFNTPSNIELSMIPVILELYNSYKEFALSKKMESYHAVLGETRQEISEIGERGLFMTKPLHDASKTTWKELVFELVVVSTLPDDVSIFIAARERLASLKFRLVFIDVSGEFHVLSSPEESERILRIIATSDNILAILEAYRETYPDSGKHIFFVDRLEKFSRLHNEPRAREWVRFAHLLEPSGTEVRSGGEFRDKDPMFPADELVCMMEHPESQEAVMEMIKNYPNAFANGFGCGGVINANEWLAVFRKKNFYKVLTEDLHINGIECFGVETDVPDPGFIEKWARRFDDYTDPIFLEGAKRFYATIEPLLDEAGKKYLHSFDALQSLNIIFSDNPKAFGAIVSMTADELRPYAKYMSSIFVFFSKSVKYKNFRKDVAISGSDVIKLLMVLAYRDIHLIFPVVMDELEIEFEEGSRFAFFADIAAAHPEVIKRLASDPRLIKWYKKLTAENLSDSLPYDTGLPRVSADDYDVEEVTKVFESMLVALPQMFDRREAFIKLNTIYHSPQFSWGTLAAIFGNPELLAAIESDEFFAFWKTREGDMRGPAYFSQLITEVAKLMASGVDAELLAAVKDLGYELTTHNVMSLLKGKEGVLRDERFKAFHDAITETYLKDAHYLNGLPALIELYEVSGGGEEALAVLTADKCKKLIDTIRHNFETPMSAHVVLTAYKLLTSDAGAEKVFALMNVLSRKPRSNDLALFIAVSQNKRWETLLKDREKLEEAVAEKLEGHKPKLRIYDDFTNSVTSEAQARLDGYTERPNLAGVDLLYLLRTYIMLEALEDEVFLREAEGIAVADIKDKRTEYGGTVVYDPVKKRAGLKTSTSLSFENGAFYTAGNSFIQDALFTFHMHATQVDDSVYAGPSGMSGFTELGGDYGHTQGTGMPDMVITSCGTDASGHLNLDYDIYYVHVPERTAGEAVHVKFRGIPVIVGSGLRHSTNTYIGLDDGQPKDTPSPNNNGNNIKLSGL